MAPQLVYFGLWGVLLWGGLLLLAPFWSAIFWALVLVIITWPFYLRLQGYLGADRKRTAFAMTILLTLGLLLPLTALGLALSRDAVVLYQNFSLDSQQLSSSLRSFPLVGKQAAEWVAQLDTPTLQAGLRDRLEQVVGWSTTLAQAIFQSVLSLGLSLFSTFFVYYRGSALTDQWQRGVERIGGKDLTLFFEPLVETIRAVILGLFATALVQGFLGSVGFALLGAQGAALWGLILASLSLFQIPTMTVWLPVALGLLLTGGVWQAIALVLWGQFVIVPVGNVLKPILISQRTGLPFLVMFFGVLGGLLAFGPTGIVLGPVILALGFRLWRRWLAREPN